MKRLIILIFILTIAHKAAAQNDSIIIKGFIKDTLNGEAIPFVDITLDAFCYSNGKCKYRTQSDIDGFFKLKIAKSDLSNTDHKLFFRFIGYEIRPVIINAPSAKNKLIIYGRPAVVQLRHDDPVELQIPKKDR